MIKSNPKRFFNYSFTELGLYDLPANIQAVLSETGR